MYKIDWKYEHEVLNIHAKQSYHLYHPYFL